jgi:hypothetical protein
MLISENEFADRPGVEGALVLLVLSKMIGWRGCIKGILKLLRTKTYSVRYPNKKRVYRTLVHPLFFTRSAWIFFYDFGGCNRLQVFDWFPFSTRI